ncbi:hypothetical protein OS493_025500 [Desmophyllum pertusum]|uniref:Uncharacterized protein n=1 Tax=Desmophyllum pertusum TaxID=174260 RepID=A0A9X0CJJ3_9CNID|nr:hypothetical protein OS493_025500 [Desmophyllum pertusum]
MVHIISKGSTLKTSTTNSNARALGDASLYQSYFVCVTESDKGTLIEYGKSLGTSDSGDIYLNLIDSEDTNNVRFYGFGNDANPAKVMDAHLVSRQLTKAECKGDTVKDLVTSLCVQKCHKDCDPLAGCKTASDSPALSDGCNACRVALDVENDKCIPKCPEHKTLTKDKKFKLNQLKDLKWHQICVTWSGFNGVVHYYLDGKNVFSGTSPTRGEIQGGKSITVGSDQHFITEFNLWDRVLDEQEIANNAKKCDGGKGNVIQWHQAYANRKYTTPSVCEVESEDTEQNPGSQNDSVSPPDIESSG